MAVNLAMKLKIDLIIGDALQVQNLVKNNKVYKNWPILTNFPNRSLQEKVNFRLLGCLDGFKDSITTVELNNFYFILIQLQEYGTLGN